jgi:cell division protein FtsX
MGAGAAMCTLLLIFAFNAYFQAAGINRALSQNVQISVFMRPDNKAAPEVTLEKLSNLDGVARADYVPKEKVLERALADNTKIKNVILSGENPFTPYYILVPAETSVVSARALTDKINKIDGVEEAVFDENLFSAVEKSARFASVYRMAGYAGLAAAFLIIAVKLVFRCVGARADLRRYAFNVLTGAAAGAVAAGIYYFIAASPSADTLRLPFKFAGYFAGCGILFVLLWEKDQG